MVIVIIKASPETKSLIAKNIFETLGAIRRIRIDLGAIKTIAVPKSVQTVYRS